MSSLGRPELCTDHPHCIYLPGHMEPVELFITPSDAKQMRDICLVDFERILLSLEELEIAEGAEVHKYAKVHILIRHARNLFRAIA